MNDVIWENQHCGVHQCPFFGLLALMPDLSPILDTFPDDPYAFTWDVRVSMLMPGQYPCIPNWHYDNVPRVNGIQRFDLIKPLPMYFWISGPPYTQFRHGYALPKVWHRFTQMDEHRGTAAGEFTWRGFIRATHYEIAPPKKGPDWQRRHSQVYLNADTFQW